MSDPYVERAKEALRKSLSSHPDEGVRALNELAKLPDDHPSVVKIAAALRASDEEVERQ